MTAEDLTGGDWAYVEWAGEAKLLTGLQAELEELERASFVAYSATGYNQPCRNERIENDDFDD